MPLPIIANTFRTVLQWTESLTGLTAHNVMHFKTAGSGRTAAQVYTCLNTHVTQAMWDFAATTAVVNEVAITPLDGVSAARVTSTGSPSKWQGAGAGQALPQVAGEISFATGLRGPAHRGRAFIPFVGEGEVSGRNMVDVAAVAAAWAAFISAVDTDATTPMDLVIASYANGTAAIVTSLTVKGTSYTMGKRNPH